MSLLNYLRHDLESACTPLKTLVPIPTNGLWTASSKNAIFRAKKRIAIFRAATIDGWLLEWLDSSVVEATGRMVWWEA